MGILGRGRDPYEPTIADSLSAGMEKGGKIYKWLFNIALFALFVPVAVIVVGLTRGGLSSTLVLWMSIIAIVGFSCITSLYWVRFLEAGKNKIVSIVFLSLNIATALIWVICAIVIHSMYNNIKDANLAYNFPAALNFIKVVLIVTLQFLTANFIARMVIKYKKTYIGVQVIAYASHAYIDLWLTLLLWCLIINKTEFAFNWNLFNFIIGPTMLTIFILAVIYSVIVSAIIKSTDRRKIVRMANNMDNVDFEGNIMETPRYTQPQQPVQPQQPTQPATAEPSVEEKLAKLKSLYDQHLITEEEYNKKRNEILSDM